MSDDEISYEDQLATERAAGAPMPTITCACGFTVSGLDEGNNVQAHADHACELLGDAEVSWHESLFSFFGAVVVLGGLLVIGVIVEQILKLSS